MESTTERLLLGELSPTASSQRLRQEVLHLLRRNVEKCLGVVPFVACYGSFPLQTYLPCGDLDLTLIVPSQWACDFDLLGAVRSQMDFVSRIRPQFHIRCIQEVKAEVKVLKLLVRGVAVDLSVNQCGGLAALRLFELVDSLCASHLFKRALFVAKAWAMYEGRVSGSQFGLLASYAIGVLIIAVLNTVPAARSSPVLTLVHMLQLIRDTDWEQTVATCFGVVSLLDYEEGGTEVLAGAEGLMFSASDLQLPRQSGCLPRKYMHIADPLKPDNNLGRSVCKGSLERIRLAAIAGLQRYETMGECGLFPSLMKADIDSGRTSPSTGPSSEEERWEFACGLEDAERAVLRAESLIDGEWKPWVASRAPWHLCAR